MIILQPAVGGLLTINGAAGGKLQELLNANRGIPGKEFIPHEVNVLQILAQLL